MSYYTNTSAHHRGTVASSFDRVDLAREFDEPEKSMFEMDTMSDDSTGDRVNVFIVFVFILEFLVLIFISVLEFFLRSVL